MSDIFRQVDRDTLFLLPPSMEDWLPEGHLGTVDSLLADVGYFSGANVENCRKEQILPFISAHRDKHNQSLKERFSKPAPLAEDADAVEAIWTKLPMMITALMV